MSYAITVNEGQPWRLSAWDDGCHIGVSIHGQEVGSSISLPRSEVEKLRDYLTERLGLVERASYADAD